jgi:hypothetical protein
MVPTFTMSRSMGLAPSFFPCNLATSTPQAFVVASPPAQATGFGVAGQCCAQRALLTRPYPPDLSWHRT